MNIKAYIESGIIESYVLGLASVEEGVELDVLRLKYPEIEEAISDFSILLENQAFKQAIIPPPQIKSKVFAAIGEEKSKARVVPLHNSKDKDVTIVMNSFRFWKRIAAASIIFLISSTALNIFLFNRYSSRNKAYLALLSERNVLQANNQVYQTTFQEWQTASAMMADTNIAIVKLPGVAGKKEHQATIFWNSKNKNVYLMPNKLPAPKAGKQFQLWALVNGKPVDAGMLDPSCKGVCKMKNIPAAQAFAITLEKEGGSTTPTMEEMYVLGKV